MSVIQQQAFQNVVRELSGHSFRVGAALDLLNDGYGLEKIMLKGGWRIESTALRYLRIWSEI
jgi:rRNA processing protein Krr1/Pno1